jgi:uncharacterized protein
MNIEKIEQVACECMAGRQDTKEREPGWLFFHGRRVGRIALWLARELTFKVDQDVVYAGALFHDIGKGSEEHNEAGAAVTREKLAGLCLPAELDAICNIVRDHNQRDHTPRHTEAVRLVQDADVLDHAGHMDIWMAFYWSGIHCETFQDHVNFIQGEENAATQARMRDGLNFDLSRRIFDDRIDFEKKFFAQFKSVYLNGI